MPWSRMKIHMYVLYIGLFLLIKHQQLREVWWLPSKDGSLQMILQIFIANILLKISSSVVTSTLWQILLIFVLSVNSAWIQNKADLSKCAFAYLKQLSLWHLRRKRRLPHHSPVQFFLVQTTIFIIWSLLEQLVG